MNNGQVVSMASVPTVMPLASQEQPLASVAVPTDVVQQNGENFAGVLSSIQLLAKEKNLSDSGQVDKLMVTPFIQPLPLAVGAEAPAVELMAQLQAAQQIVLSSGVVTPNPENPDRADINDEEVAPQQVELPEVTAQMFLSAYSQPGRMPEVNQLTPLPVDGPQNVAKAIAQLAVITAPAVPNQTEAAVPSATVQVETSLLAAPVQPETKPTAAEVNILAPLPVEQPQNAAGIAAQPAVITAPAADNQLEAAVAMAETVQTSAVERTVEPLETAPLVAPTAVQTAPDPVKPETIAVQSGAKPAIVEVNVLTPLPVDRPQNVAAATAQHAVITAPDVNSQPKAAVAEAAVQAAPVLADSRSTAGLLQQAYGVRQKSLPEQQNETVHTSADQRIVKETASSQQPVVSKSESTSGSDVAGKNSSNEGQAFSSPNNQTLTQQMQGQLSTEHQKPSAVNSTSVPSEPVRQDIPGQDMQNTVQQLKERLLQHDVKPGNQHITLTLSPENLGELKMNLNLQGQKLSVEIITENRSVRDAIVLHTDALKESLSRQNITMESFDVTTGGKGSGGQGQNQNAWRELAKQQQQQQFWTPPRGDLNTAQTDLPAGQAAYQKQYGQTMLDIHY